MSKPPARSLLVLAGALVLPVTASACGGTGAPSGETKTQVAASRCTHVPRALVDRIETRLTARETLRNAQAVRDRARAGIWFISAEIEGPGLEGAGAIGTWAKVGPLAAGGGPILSVDSVFAQQQSGWTRGDLTNAYLTMDDASAEKSRDCVEHG